MCDAACWDDDAARFAFRVGSTATVTHTMLPKFEWHVHATARILIFTNTAPPAAAAHSLRARGTPAPGPPACPRGAPARPLALQQPRWSLRIAMLEGADWS